MKQMTIVGNLGADAITREVNGNKFVSFQVAVNEKYTKSDNTQVESTQWFTCTTKHLKLAPHLKKGDQVMVQGNFKTTVYQDSSNQWKAGIDLNAQNIQLLTPKSAQEDKEGMELLRKIVRDEIKHSQHQS